MCYTKLNSYLDTLTSFTIYVLCSFIASVHAFGVNRGVIFSISSSDTLNQMCHIIHFKQWYIIEILKSDIFFITSIVYELCSVLIGWRNLNLDKNFMILKSSSDIFINIKNCVNINPVCNILLNPVLIFVFSAINFIVYTLYIEFIYLSIFN